MLIFFIFFLLSVYYLFGAIISLLSAFLLMLMMIIMMIRDALKVNDFVQEKIKEERFEQYIKLCLKDHEALTLEIEKE